MNQAKLYLLLLFVGQRGFLHHRLHPLICSALYLCEPVAQNAKLVSVAGESIGLRENFCIDCVPNCHALYTDVDSPLNSQLKGQPGIIPFFVGSPLDYLFAPLNAA